MLATVIIAIFLYHNPVVRLYKSTLFGIRIQGLLAQGVKHGRRRLEALEPTGPFSPSNPNSGQEKIEA